MKRQSFFIGFGIRYWFINENWRRALAAIVPRAMINVLRLKDIF